MKNPQVHKPTDMTYYFYSQKHPNRGIAIKSTKTNLVESTDFDSRKKTVFVVHGWRNHNESKVNKHIRQAMLHNYDVNVFVVDWSPWARKDYIAAKNAVVKVGNYLADFIKTLTTDFGLKLSAVKLVGFSLGAHVSGNAGK